MSKTTIEITGQIGSIHTLLSAINDYNADLVNGMFNAKRLTFPTKKEAVKALSEGRKYLIQEGKDVRGYSRGVSLSYDAGTAAII